MRPTSTWGKVLFIILQLFFAGIILFPILYAVDISFMPAAQVFRYPPNLIPTLLNFSNYRLALDNAPLLRYMLNSIIVSTCVTVGQIILASLAAFSFSHFAFKGKNLVFMMILATMMIPGESIIISNYMTMGDLHLFDTYIALILPSLASAMSVFFMRQTFLQTPKAFHEVAKLEGCSNLRYLFTLLLPISKGSLGAIGIYSFINSWNAYLWPLLVTNKSNMRTVQIGIGMLQDPEGLGYGMIMGGIVIILLPSLLIFIVGQKQILSGTLAGAIKG
ncbi:MAG: carbohydrate ABC transporter permease [Clostridia bacterium]|nr:carbohydrate ABC transporter permease [Clostridia bacterium]